MIPDQIKQKMNKNLHTQVNHPLQIIKNMIYDAIGDFDKFSFDPIVSVEDNFDKLLIPKDHPSRKPSDTYYVNNNQVLRTHTSAHQNSLLLSGNKNFVVTGDVYRRDEIDRCHYPVFHQMECVRICDNPEEDLKNVITNLVKSLFGEIQYRFVDCYFPFTEPSWELEIFWQDKWLEVAGMGLIHTQILQNCHVESKGWAFGLGLERLAMILFEIPDIRLFWSEDKRFLDQFKNGPTKFVPYSKFPSCYKDIAFWCEDNYSHNDFYDLVRELGGDMVESVTLIDSFSKNNKTSNCYRINYQDITRTLVNKEVNVIQQNIRDCIEEKLHVILR